MSMLRVRLSFLLLLAYGIPCALHAQTDALPKGKPQYSRKNALSITGEYSGTSSHIHLGEAMNRKLVTAGVAYTRRIAYSQYLDLQYLAELRPIVMESDPTAIDTMTITTPQGTSSGTSTVVLASSAACPEASTQTYTGIDSQTGATYTWTVSDTYSCGHRRWTYGQALSPAGLKLNLLPRYRLQPVLTASGGYLFTTKPIPMTDSGSFNFTVAFGAGLEFYLRSNRSDSFFGNRSIRVEYRYHHISNAYSAADNPGIDNGVLHVAYSFGH